MTKGLYIGASGMLSEVQRQNVISNNLANVNTTGYKKDIAVSKAFPSMLLRRINDNTEGTSIGLLDNKPIVGTVGAGVLPDVTAHDFTQGGIRETGGQLDVAIEDVVDLTADNGKGFFVIQTEGGDRYTKNGSFYLDTQRRLVTSQGFLVLGENGPITVQDGVLAIDEDGKIFVNGTEIDKLRIVELQPSELVKIGDSLFAPAGTAVVPQAATQVKIKWQHLEDSNVNVVTAMVDMITALRAYEANQRVVRAQDDTIEMAIRDVGGV